MFVRWTSRWKKPAAVLVAISAAVTAALLIAPAASAATNAGGRVTCTSAAAIQGIYVNANNGGSGWANFSRVNGNSANWSKSLPNGGSYYLSVGCGGNSSSWKTTLYSDTLQRNSSDLVCQDVRGQARFGRCF